MSVERAVEQIRRGGLVIIGDPEREGEYDFVASAKLVTEESFHIMMKAGGAFIACFMPHGRCGELGIPNIPGGSLNNTRFMVSVDGVGQKSGSSLKERLGTVRALGGASSGKDDFVKPGHVIPIEARAGLLKDRLGHTEAGVYLMTLCGINPPVAVDIEILGQSGEMAGIDEIRVASEVCSIPIVNINDLLEHSSNA